MDVAKLFALLVIVIYIMGLLRALVSPERVREFVRGRPDWQARGMAVGLGAVMPFCSCSSVPLFIGFVEAGIPLGVTFSFLIASPMINEVAALLLIGILGWKLALLYIGAGLVVAWLGGLIMQRFKPERWVEDYVWKWVLLGIGVGALFHGFVPEQWVVDNQGDGQRLAVPGAVLVGISLYSNATGVIPVAEAMLGKGVAVGTVLALMMSIAALSVPEMLILRKVIRWPSAGALPPAYSGCLSYWSDSSIASQPFAPLSIAQTTNSKVSIGG